MIELSVSICLVSCFCVDYFFCFFFGFRTRESSLHTNCLLSEKNFGVIFKNFTVTVSLVSNRKQKKHYFNTNTLADSVRRTVLPPPAAVDVGVVAKMF